MASSNHKRLRQVTTVPIGCSHRQWPRCYGSNR